MISKLLYAKLFALTKTSMPVLIAAAALQENKKTCFCNCHLKNVAPFTTMCRTF